MFDGGAAAVQALVTAALIAMGVLFVAGVFVGWLIWG